MESRLGEIRDILRTQTDSVCTAKSADASQRTPLHLAARRGDVKLATILLEFGANVNAEDSEPATVLDLAVSSNHRKFVVFLISNGVDETWLLKRNIFKFRETKRVIEYSKSSIKTPCRKDKKVRVHGEASLYNATSHLMYLCKLCITMCVFLIMLIQQNTLDHQTGVMCMLIHRNINRLDYSLQSNL